MEAMTDKDQEFVRDALLMALGALSVSPDNTLVSNTMEKVKRAIAKIDEAKI